MKLLATVGVLFFLLSGSAWADVCSLLFHFQDNPGVVSLYVRDLDRPVTDGNYLQNITDSLKTHFVPWFEGKQKSDYIDVIERQHRVAVMGLDGRTYYQSPSLQSRDQSMPLRSIGKVRLKILGTPEQTAGFTLESLCARYDCPTNYLERIKGFDGKSYRLDLSGILVFFSLRVQVTKLNSGLHYVLLHYPSSLSTYLYLNKMSVIMKRLRALPPRSPAELWMQDLADYIQLFAVSKPFEQVNFSIAMSHANYILVRNGYRGISHGALDYMAMTHSTEAFRTIFKEAVDKGQLP